MRIRISADSTCDLSPELIEQYDVAITPLYIRLGEKDLKDSIEVTRADIFRYVEETKTIPKTAAVNVGDYVAFFRSAKEEGYDGVVHFTISSDMSSCYQNACLAAEGFENVFIVDSRTLSTGIGHLVLDACELRDEGKTAKEIFEIVEQRKEKLDVSFVLDTLRYLALGGRCNSLLAFGANLLNIKPSIRVKDGVMGVDKKYRCSFERAVVRYVNDKLADRDSLNLKRIFITDSGVNDEVFNAVRDAVLKNAPFAEVHHTRAGCTVSSHCGPNCIGILFYRN
ncbi:MAG: DegV family protein [Clostridia bacterium]|nr:DegV family protein [Clostridia bacterium]